MGERGCGCSCIIFSVSYVTGTPTYPQTEFWVHTGHLERGACLSFHTEVKKQNKTQLLVYSLGIFKFANAKMCWLDFPGVRKGTVSSETVIKRVLGLGLEKGYSIDKQKGGFRNEPRSSRGWGHKHKLHMEMSQWNP